MVKPVNPISPHPREERRTSLFFAVSRAFFSFTAFTDEVKIMAIGFARGFGAQGYNPERRKVVMDKWDKNPYRLLNALGIKEDGCGQGIVCPYCGSGSHSHGTGPTAYNAESNGELRFKCHACGENMSPIDLVIYTRHLQPEDIVSAIQYMEEIYEPEVSELDTYLKGIYYRYSRGYQMLLDDLNVDYVVARTVQARKACPAWQERVAKLLGLPAWALDRPDVGKSSNSESDWADPDFGHLVMFNLEDGHAVAAKVRKVSHRFPMVCLNASTGMFDRLLKYEDGCHVFRMTGSSGRVCFGHDYVTPGIATVVVVEGQSDVLAVSAALKECGCDTEAVCIGRDASSHILKETDLKVLAGRQVVYVEDNDDAGKQYTAQNVRLLQEGDCSVKVWSAPDGYKDPREYYIQNGAAALVNALRASNK